MSTTAGRQQQSIQTAPSQEAHLGSQTENGSPAPSDRNSLTLGSDGPMLLHDVHFLNQMAHFNRERVPERNVHAKGSGAFGTFEVTHDISRYTKAAFLQPGVKTEILARFSTVAGEQGSRDTWRDPRGFSQFPHFIRSQKRMAATGLRDNTMQWDFWSPLPDRDQLPPAAGEPAEGGQSQEHLHVRRRDGLRAHR